MGIRDFWLLGLGTKRAKSVMRKATCEEILLAADAHRLTLLHRHPSMRAGDRPVALLQLSFLEEGADGLEGGVVLVARPFEGH